nr:MAG TPA: hypothetical protein [Caudoviricetes sp.]DAS83185.1 MAG TPA: hypothetical protein [Caudoviricetes sp.]
MLAVCYILWFKGLEVSFVKRDNLIAFRNSP